MLFLGAPLPRGGRTAWADEADGTVPLRLWNIPAKGSTNPLFVAKRRVFEAFCKKYPHIKVTALVPLRIEGPAAEGNEFLAVAGGVAPDVFYLFGRKIGDYYDQGFLYPLDGFLAEQAKQTGKPYTGISAPSPVWELCQIDGHIYCVPYLYYSMALMCREDLFARATVPLRSPRDWNELYQFARRLTFFPSKEPGAKPGDPKVYGLYVLTGIYAGWHFLQYIWSSGGEVVQAYHERPDGELVPVPAPPVDYRKWHIRISDGERYYDDLTALRESLRAKGINPDYSMVDLKWRLVTNDEAGTKALEFYRRLIHSRWIRCQDRHENREFDLTPEMLRSGVAVCPVCGRKEDISTPEGRRRVYHGVAQVGQQSSRDGNVQFAIQIGTLEEATGSTDVSNLVPLPFPSRTAETPPAAFIAGHYLGINATQKNPKIRKAAWDYSRYVTGPEAQRIRVATYVEFGLEEYIRPQVLESLGYDVELARIPPERRKLWDLLERYAKVEPYCPGFQHVMTRELGIPIDAIIGDEPDENNAYTRDPAELMETTGERVNSLILGELPEEVVRWRSKIGWVVAAIVVGLLAFATYGTVRLAMRMHQRAADLEGFGIQGKTMRRAIVATLFLAPAIGSILLWGYYPLAKGTGMAFADYKILGGSSFVGLRNFVEATSSPEFWRYVVQTFYYLVLSLTMGFLAPIALAIFLTEIPKGKILYRTIYYLPAVTTGIVTLFMWKQLLYDQSRTGLINSIILTLNDRPPWLMVLIKGLIFGALVLATAGLGRLALRRDVEGLGRVVPLVLAVAGLVYLVYRAVGIAAAGSPVGLLTWFARPWDFKPQKFLQDRNMAMFWVVVPTVWAGLGPGCLIYLAALKGVPEEQYEAADLDGASVWAKVVHIVFPNLSALILINFVGAVVGAMRASQNVFVMTGGGPEDVTMTVGLSVWFNAYMFLNFGLATAQAWILGAMLIGFTLYQLRMLNRMQFRAVATKEARK